MSRIHVDIIAARAENARLPAVISRAADANTALRRLQSSVDPRILRRSNLQARLDTARKGTADIERQVQSIHTGIAQFLDQYADTERRICSEAVDKSLGGKEIGNLSWQAAILALADKKRDVLDAVFDVDTATFMLAGMRGAIGEQSVDAYKAAIESWIAEELGLEPGEIDAFFYIASIELATWERDGGYTYLHFEAVQKSFEIRDKIVELKESLENSGNPSQLRALEYLNKKWLAPNYYRWARDVAEMRDVVVSTIINAGLNAGIGIILAPIKPLKLAWKTYKWGGRAVKVAEALGGSPPPTVPQIREVRDIAIADLSLSVSLYNNLRANGQASQADIDRAFLQTVDSTSAILQMELAIEQRNEMRLAREPIIEPPRGLNGELLNPVEARTQQDLEASRQRLETIQKKIDEVEALRTSEPTSNSNNVLRNAAMLFGG